ncbi:dimethyl sulfoxide reductase [Denitrobacterium detoxificans]|uniref:Tat-targeted selenate reductase subunit YnfF n=1 Tax=Denitrobacterium detoxificans TaxID=79604 RepID=A0A172RWB1_9ACTN|nr:DMSO/selenate family reductase complex A subunit [Denitrobacterium detoxificans]ANE21997.1 dimethyl sulfoxide reductase [Denitrobacterium detoxificans]SEO97031.1 Tat-targeted selenate reductase subunit YnfF [Denitrobacterium detoxificans]
MTEQSMSRRSFVKTSGALAGLAAAGGTAVASQELFSAGEAHAADADTIAWSQCNVNCGGNCIFQWHVRDGKVAYMETDNTGDADFQARACLRGRSMRRWLNNADRLMYPMKRVGKRGEGKFERISWDEAIQTIADQLEYTYKTYGPNSIYIMNGTGTYFSMSKVGHRLLSLAGGYVSKLYDYSTHQLSAAMPYMFGFDEELGSVFSPYDNVNASSFTEAEQHSDLIVMFGNSPADTRMGGANATWDFARAREGVKSRGGKVVNIDYRMNESASGHADEWLPIRTGTDAALCAALIHEFIKDGKADLNFLHTYCVGFDEETMPESAKGKNKSFYAYIMGEGYDMVEKTPEWAAPITQIPASRIRELAKDLESAKAPFVCQGWGPQRHSNGEDTSRMISMVPVVLGQIGLPGTNTGQREAEPPVYLVGNIPFKNPNKTQLPVYQYLNAVDHGKKMTALNSGILGADELGTDLKFLWNFAGNCLTNQHGDVNKTHEILADESKCEFILVWDTVMTDSAKYADILLPDMMRSEVLNMQTQGYSEYYTGVTVGGPAQEAPGECRNSYDVCADIAEKLGFRDEYTEGRSYEEWVEYLYNKGRDAAADPVEGYGINMPTWDQIRKDGVFKMECEPAIGLEDFRNDPVANPLGTPSGKIEIYSETLATIAETWELEEDEEIHAIPMFWAGPEGYGSVTSEYPLYCSGFHYKSRTHSSFGFIEELKQACRQQMWINPIDAESRGIANGDMCLVSSPAGKMQIEAKVTERIIPGTIGIPQGAWHDADMDGDKIDKGGCVNTLTTYRPTPLAKGNGPAHSIIAQVAKA